MTMPFVAPIRNQRDRLPFETDDAYQKRLRGINNSYHMTSHRTVAQDKRNARKARNRANHKKHL